MRASSFSRVPLACAVPANDAQNLACTQREARIAYAPELLVILPLGQRPAPERGPTAPGHGACDATALPADPIPLAQSTGFDHRSRAHSASVSERSR